MRKPSKTRSQNIDSNERRRSTRTSNRDQRGTSRGTERVREYRGESRNDFNEERNYDRYDRDLSRDNDYDRDEYERRGGNNRRYDYGFEDEYPENQYSGRHRRHEWDEGFGEFDDYDQYEDDYQDDNFGMSDDMEDRRYDDLYRGRLKRRNTPRGFSTMSLREVQDRGRNSARRSMDIIPSHWSSSGSFDRNARPGIRGRRRSGGAYHNDDDIQYAAPIGYEKDTQRRDYKAGEQYERRRRTSRQNQIEPERLSRKNRSERGTAEEARSNLGNSAPGSRIMGRRPKTRKKGSQYVPVVDQTPVVTRSKRRGTTSGKRARKSKNIKNY
jgi:hypothetical protein